jgi:hypothetical protein
MAMDAGTNKITLDKELVDELKGYQKRIRENTVSIARKAFQIRSQYISADGRKYDENFEKWWSTHNLDSVFGKRANFTKWASSGEAIEKSVIEGHDERMPTTLTALYEIAQLRPEEVKLGLQDTYTRTSLTEDPKGNKKPKPLIHPEATAAEIRSWRKRWRSPKAKSTEKRRLAFATIKVHGSLYDFDKSGKHEGILTPDKLKDIYDALISSMKPYNEFAVLETNLEPLLEGHAKRQEKAEDRARREAIKKSRRQNQRRKISKRYSGLGSSSVFREKLLRLRNDEVRAQH